MWKFSNPKTNFFFSKIFQPTNAAEKALCTKRHFSNGNHSKKKKFKIPKISKILLRYFPKKKIEEKINNKKKIYFLSLAPAAPQHHFFFGACGASFFFIFNRKSNFLRKKWFFFSKKIHRSIKIGGGDQTCKFPHFWNVTPP